MTVYLPPLIKPCMRFSRTRLSGLIHRMRFHAGIFHGAVRGS